MTLHYRGPGVTVHHGDCLDVLATLPDASVDAVVTDPPYGLGFMGKEWDKIKQDESRPPSADEIDARFNNKFPRTGKGPAATAFDGLAFQLWCQEWAAECLRVLKPGGHMLAFGGTRTWHRLACAVEDAGFDVRDSIAWLYGSGFPKSLDVSKAIDKAAGAEREVVGLSQFAGRGRVASGSQVDVGRSEDLVVTAPATPDAERWQGWGTALKPAFEPIVVARKPLVGTVANNVLTYGTGALNVDACRIEGQPRTTHADGNRRTATDGPTLREGLGLHDDPWPAPAGRWPANVVLDETQAALLDEQSGESVTPSTVTRGGNRAEAYGMGRQEDVPCYGDLGGASRFFYVAKADSSERVRLPKVGAGEGRVTGLGGKIRECNTCGSRAINSGANELSCGHLDHKWVENRGLRLLLIRL